MKESILRLIAAIAEYILLKSDPAKTTQTIHNAEYRILRLAALMAHYSFYNLDLADKEKNAKRKTVYLKRFEAYRKKFYAYIAKE